MSREHQILHHLSEGKSQRMIAGTLGVSRNTVASVYTAAMRFGRSYSELLQLDETALFQTLFPEKAAEPVLVPPDYEKIHKELLRHGVTLRLLWEEYADACREAKQPPYMYSQFCKRHADYVDQNRLTMHIQHKPGDKLMVDWAGTKLAVYDRYSEASQTCYLFVAVLPFSMYCYAEAFVAMKQEDWITAHIHLYSFLGGSTRLLVIYTEEELPFMQPLPLFPYEFASWKVATVQLNYHVSFDKQYYSVPYAYARKKVDIRSTDTLIEIYYQGNRICSHKRLHGRMGQYAANSEHMPKNHQLYSEWNADRFKRWASDIGPSAREDVDKLFASYRVEEQAYKGCLSLLKLADRYPSDRLENACRVALMHIQSPRYKNIRLILEAGQDLPKKQEDVPKDDAKDINSFTHLRGASYYGGGRHES